MNKDVLADPSVKILQAFDFASEIAAKDREHQAQWQALLLSLLEVMDSFERFFAGVESSTKPPTEQAGTWLNTFQLIGRQLEHVLSDAGLTTIACLGQVVDPKRHEIVEVKETDKVEDDIVIEVMVQGYEWHGQLLRRPQVVVARKMKEAQ